MFRKRIAKPTKSDIKRHEQGPVSTALLDSRGRTIHRDSDGAYFVHQAVSPSTPNGLASGLDLIAYEKDVILEPAARQSGRLPLAACALAGTALLAAALPAAADYANIQPGYMLDEDATTLRLEGKAGLAGNATLFGFLDLDSGDSRSDFENFYLETRLSYGFGSPRDTTDVGLLRSIIRDTGATAELNSGNGFQDFVRMGLIYVPRTGEGTFALLKVYPFDTGDAGPQVSVYAEGDLSDRFNASFMADINIDPFSLYLEPKAQVGLTKKLDVMLHPRISIGTDRMSPDLVLGLNYTF
ncbi:MAG: hypothetical protein ABH879_05445 [archaeon]